MSDTSRWQTSKVLAAFLGSKRDNDVKVMIHGVPVPILDCYYSSAGDQFVIELDEESTDYTVATSFCPTQPQELPE